MNKVCFLHAFVCAVLSFFVIVAGMSFSSIITYEFTATIDSIDGQYGQVDVTVGQSVSGWFSYDDAVPNAYTGSYPEAIGSYSQNASMSVTLGSQTISCVDSPTNIGIHNAITSHPSDDDHFSFFMDRVPIIEAGDYSDMSVELHDLSKTAFNNVALTQLLELSNFGTTKFTCPIAEGPGMDYYFIAEGSLTSLRLVPEPTTLMLLGLGLLFPIKRRCRLSGKK